MLNVIKNFVLWRYARGTWQWDTLCIVIMMFIFLTPKAWFEKKERLFGQNTKIARVVIAEENLSQGEIEERVKELSGDPNAKVLEWQQKIDKDGKKFYEVDLR